MTHILTTDDPAKERQRLLRHARHCRDLANSCADAQVALELAALAKSYEAKASLTS
jgi:hypothetical protein